MNTFLTDNKSQLTKLSHEIHRRESVLFIIRKAEQGKMPYVFYYKDVDKREAKKELTENELKVLRWEREHLKKTTPKEILYPKRKYCGGRYNKYNQVKTLIMQDCVRAGFDIKEIAGYFNLSLSPVYRRVKLKGLVEFKKAEINYGNIGKR